MKLDFIPLDKLSVSKANMRFSKSVPDVSDILPTVRKRGVIQPIIVRPQPCPEPVEGCAPDAFEILAGSRRYHAALVVAEEKRAMGETLKALIRDALDGTNGRDKKDRWVPRWMQFPPSGYSQRGGIGTVAACDALMKAKAVHDSSRAEPDMPDRCARGRAVPLPDDGEEGGERLAA